MQLQRVLETLGYSASEAKVYLAMLAIGEARVSDIAAKTKLPRTSVQSVVDMLRKDGLVNYYTQRRFKYWVADNPERLLAHVRRKEEMLRAALPELAALRQGARGKRATEDDALGVFRIVADTASQPVLIANEAPEIEYVNAAWEAQFGYALDEVKGHNPRILQSGKTPKAVYERMWKALAAGRMFQTDEVVDKRKDGSLFTLLSTVFSVRHSGCLFYIQILDDLSARRRVDVAKSRFLALAAE